MNNRKFLRWLSVLAMLLLALLVAGCASEPPAANTLSPQSTLASAATMEPRPAPTRTFTLLGGEETTLEQWRGQGVILNFWATWCAPCRTEMPLLAEMHEKYADSIEVVGVNYLENEESVAGFVSQFEIPFPVVVDERGWLASELDVKGLPTTIYINADGQIVGSKIGPVTEEELEMVIPMLTQ